jgi:hypothetical protein
MIDIVEETCPVHEIIHQFELSPLWQLLMLRIRQYFPPAGEPVLGDGTELLREPCDLRIGDNDQLGRQHRERDRCKQQKNSDPTSSECAHTFSNFDAEPGLLVLL